MLTSCRCNWLGCWARGYLVYHLIEHFILLNHAQFAACPLLNRSITLLEVAHFSVQGIVALFERRIVIFLRNDFLVQVPDSQPATLAQPQWILQQGDHGYKDQGKKLHLRL